MRSGGERAQARLVVFPHSAAGPNALLPVVQRLPDTVELIGVTLPGRERRFGESPSTTLADTLANVRRELAERQPLPTSLFGHSLGASVAFALALSTQDVYHAVVVSGQLPTRLPNSLALQATDAQLVSFLQSAGQTEPEILRDEFWRRHLLHLLRCDLALAHAASDFGAGGVIQAHLLALGGAQDRQVEPALLGGWHSRTASTSAVRIFPGGHFYLLDRHNVPAITEELRTLLTRTEVRISNHPTA